MIIYYDTKEKLWFHTDGEAHYTLGVEETPIPYRRELSPSSIPFHVSCRQHRNLGPLITILGGQAQQQSVIGNVALFKQLQQRVHDNGGIAVVTTAELIRETRVDGYLFVPRENQWIEVQIPYPHIVFNRVPFRKQEQSKPFQAAIEAFKKRGSLIFNPSFLNKYELYLMFKDHPTLGPYFPETINITEMSNLREFLGEHQHIYVKPSCSSKGQGIFRLLQMENGIITYQNRKEMILFHDFEQFWQEYATLFQNREYIAQKGISPLLYHGKRYDFRILSHYDGSTYTVTGIGIRQSGEQSLTTHIPNGGKLLSFEEVYRKKDELFIQELVHLCGEQLAEKVGFFGEFSIDAGLTEDEQYVIYEINSKPMSFDEKEIEEERVQRLVALFEHLFVCLSPPNDVQ
ncbi:YheC/YheD family endospore coat-associated protein [Robertmurraya andreesenii]|uniref:YheC/YheD family protein n=1 Tax=Anoxybacillus andreesenii TaxID=1325932 RepID=A0ABT9UYF9_9BACL|nr:YheC/YheD family protein [Robertmurraya andreesenii]MDQ0153724.1 hypothetical protein [Robertmurraya andreesenii]